MGNGERGCGAFLSTFWEFPILTPLVPLVLWWPPVLLWFDSAHTASLFYILSLSVSLARYSLLSLELAHTRGEGVCVSESLGLSRVHFAFRQGGGSSNPLQPDKREQEKINPWTVKRQPLGGI